MISFIFVLPIDSIVENKRKGDDGSDNPLAKNKCLDKQRCSDLIVLGLPWKSTEDDLRRYFSQFGDILLVQVSIKIVYNREPAMIILLLFKMKLADL